MPDANSGFPPIPGYEFVPGRPGFGCGTPDTSRVIYRARKAESGALVVVLVGNPGPVPGSQEWLRLSRLRAAQRRLEHPSIIRLIEVGEVEGRWYEAWEHVGSLTLKDRLTHGPLSATEAMTGARALASTLQYARDQDMIAGPLTPGSIFVTQENIPKLSDFHPAGSAREGETAVTPPELLGDPAFMPPEWFTGLREVTAAADVYRVGAVMYAMLTGQPPFVADKPPSALRRLINTVLRSPSEMLVLAFHICNTPPKPLRQLDGMVPDGLEVVCMRCLEKLPERRYATPRDVADAIASLMESSPR